MSPKAPGGHGRVARARHAIQQLTPETIEQIATRVAALLRTEPAASRHADAAPESEASPAGLLTASQLAQRLGVSRTWVYENARKLGAISLGDGPRARLRFDPDTAMRALNATPPVKPTPPKRRPRRRISDTTVPLLPIKSQSRRGLLARLGVHRAVRSR